MLQLVAASPHDGYKAKFASKVIDEIDAGEVKEAIADLLAGPNKEPKGG